MTKAKCSALLALIAVWAAVVPVADASAGSTVIVTRDSETYEVLSWDLPKPLDDYHVAAYCTLRWDGANPLSWYTDRDHISPGERVSLTVDLTRAQHSSSISFRITVMKSRETVFDEASEPIQLPAIDVPGSWSSPILYVPMITIEVIGVPAEISVGYQMSFDTSYSITVDTYGLEPGTTSLDFTASGSKGVGFGKSSGLGADITLTGSTLKIVPRISLWLGLTVFGLPTPLKNEVLNRALGQVETRVPQNLEIAVLKTPISIYDFSISSTSITPGEAVTIDGRITPGEEGVPVEILVDGSGLATVYSRNDGTFSYEWAPSSPGSFSITAVAPETRYSTSAQSGPIHLVVKEPARPFELPFVRPEGQLLIALLVLGVVIVATAIVVAARKGRKPEVKEPTKPKAPPSAPGPQPQKFVHCVECGTKNPDTNKFCTQCGEVLFHGDE